MEVSLIFMHVASLLFSNDTCVAAVFFDVGRYLKRQILPHNRL